MRPDEFTLKVQDHRKPRRRPEQSALDLGVQATAPKGGIRGPAGAGPVESGLPLFNQVTENPNQLTIERE